MAVSVYVCQGGCGRHEEGVSEMHERGITTVKLYCADCVKEIDDYLEMRDAIHTDLSTRWSEGLASLQADFLTRVKNLPDGG